jgi:hypothetical protein
MWIHLKLNDFCICTQGISVGRELAALLISLFPICLHDLPRDAAPQKGQGGPFFTPGQLHDPETVFSHKSASFHKVREFQAILMYLVDYLGNFG